MCKRFALLLAGMCDRWRLCPGFGPRLFAVSTSVSVVTVHQCGRFEPSSLDVGPKSPLISRCRAWLAFFQGRKVEGTASLFGILLSGKCLRVLWFYWASFSFSPAGRTPLWAHLPGGDVGRLWTSMAKNIYVGNLSWEATADDLLRLFERFGGVTRAQVVMDRETGRSRGFGFVEMADDNEASKAVGELNGTEFMNRTLTVNEARPREEGGGGTGGGRGGYGDS